MVWFSDVYLGGQVNVVNFFSNFVVECFALCSPAKIGICIERVWINTVNLDKDSKLQTSLKTSIIVSYQSAGYFRRCNPDL